MLHDIIAIDPKREVKGILYRNLDKERAKKLVARYKAILEDKSKDYKVILVEAGFAQLGFVID